MHEFWSSLFSGLDFSVVHTVQLIAFISEHRDALGPLAALPMSTFATATPDAPLVTCNETVTARDALVSGTCFMCGTHLQPSPHANVTPAGAAVVKQDHGHARG